MENTPNTDALAEMSRLLDKLPLNRMPFLGGEPQENEIIALTGAAIAQALRALTLEVRALRPEPAADTSGELLEILCDQMPNPMRPNANSHERRN